MKETGGAAVQRTTKKKGFFARAIEQWDLQLLVLPGIILLIVFSYLPMYGLIMSFQEFRMGDFPGMSEWVGFKQFESLFTDPNFFRTLRNTLVISFLKLSIGFICPIVFAVFLNEMRRSGIKKVVQTVSYLPHFISLVVICGLIKEFTQSTGLVSTLLAFFGVPQETMLLDPERFRAVYVISDLWQTIGWNSIIYLAALSGVDPTLYDAAAVDGAGRFRRVLHVTLPCILPTIIIMFILRVGQFMTVGYDKILLLYNSSIYETADVISTFVYRKGIVESNFSFSAAVGVFNSLVNFVLVVVVNKISAKVSETSLW